MEISSALRVLSQYLLYNTEKKVKIYSFLTSNLSKSSNGTSGTIFRCLVLSFDPKDLDLPYEKGTTTTEHQSDSRDLRRRSDGGGDLLTSSASVEQERNNRVTIQLSNLFYLVQRITCVCIELKDHTRVLKRSVVSLFLLLHCQHKIVFSSFRLDTTQYPYELQ